MDIDKADQRMFLHDTASRIRYKAQDLPANEQREEFFVEWRGANLDRVKFEYRQVNAPNIVKEQEFAPARERSHVFEIRGDDFHTGGPVSAWRASLWSGNELVAERKSALW